MIKKIFNFLLDLIWPQFCVGCGAEGSLCCPKCLDNLTLAPAQPIVWPDHLQNNFQACYVCLDYENKVIKKLIKLYKYSYIKNISSILAEILYRQAQNINLPQNTIITNIPLHSRKKRKRGFDQTALLAQALAYKLNLNYQELLIRQKNTQSQAKLDKKERQLNTAEAFILKKGLVATGPILLIDDLATTGATLNAATLPLQKAGYSPIIALVLAKNNV